MTAVSDGPANGPRTVRGHRFSLTASGFPDTFLGTLEPWRREKELDYALRSAVDDLEGLHRASERIVPQSDSAFEQYDGDLVSASERIDDDELIIAGQEVMQAWERPLMQRMAAVAARNHGDVLELGFGMGISATALIGEGLRSYTVIESNPDVQRRARAWAADRPDQRITVVDGRWQDRIDELGEFDGIFFDTYPTSEEESLQHNVEDTFYAQHFVPSAARHLRPGGVFTYYTNEIDSLSRQHQRIVLDHFSTLEISVVDGLVPPTDCTYWWASSMAVVALTK